jgi:hypothetical protein
MNFQRTLEDYKKNIDQVLQKYLEKKIKRLPVFNNAFIRQEYKLIKDFCLSNGKRIEANFDFNGLSSSWRQKRKRYLYSCFGF